MEDLGARVPSQGQKGASLEGRYNGLIPSKLTTYIPGLTPTIQCDSEMGSVGGSKCAKVRAVWVKTQGAKQ